MRDYKLRTKQQWLNYRELELIPPRSASPRINLRSMLSQCWQTFLGYVTGPSLRIWQTHDRNGQVWWWIHDPVTRCNLQFGSENELRSWIEQHLLP